MLDGHGKNAKADLHSKYLTDHERLSHLIFMLDTMRNEKDEGKLNRWIGFIQGVLWSYSWCSIDDLRRHVNSCKVDYTWSAPAGFNRGLGIEKLDQLSKLVHDDIANDVTTELIDPEEQLVYNELYSIHTNLMKQFPPK